MNKEVKKYLGEIGAKGGAAGTGKSKARSPEHYRKLVSIREFRRSMEKMTVEDACRRYQIQNCHRCENYRCGDNQNAKKGGDF